MLHLFYVISALFGCFKVFLAKIFYLPRAMLAPTFVFSYIFIVYFLLLLSVVLASFNVVLWFGIRFLYAFFVNQPPQTPRYC